jgi:predicted HAD superfamily Cof-like phosphohydrolase
MDHNQKNVKSFMLKAGQTVRDHPESDIPDSERVLSVKLLLEEVLELAAASGVSVRFVETALVETDQLEFEVSGSVDLVEVADALADIDYVNNGAANRYGLDLEPFKEEVHDSNMTKFIDGHEGQDGKWIKGPSYRPARLDDILELLEMKKKADKSQLLLFSDF